MLLHGCEILASKATDCFYARWASPALKPGGACHVQGVMWWWVWREEDGCAPANDDKPVR